MTNIINKNTGAPTAPAPRAAATHANSPRDDFAQAISDAEQASYINGYYAGKRSVERWQRFGDLTDRVAFSALGFAAGIAVALYVIAPAF